MPWYAWLIIALALGSILGSLLLLRDTAKKLPLTEDQDLLLVSTDHQFTSAHRVTTRFNDQR